MAMEGVPVEGGHFLIRNDPFIKGQELFKTKFAVCHAFTKGENDKFDSILTGKTASDLGNFGSKEWVRGLLANPMDDKHFGLVKKDEVDGDGKPVLDAKGKPVKIEGLTGMKNWRAKIDKARATKKIDAAAQDKDFDKIAEWLEYLGKTPQAERKNDALIGAGQKAFFNDDTNKCSTCHSIEAREEVAKGKFKWEKQGDATAPELTDYGSAAWIRGMIMNPAHKSRYGERNLMPAFRNKIGPGSEVLLQEFRDSNDKMPEKMIMELSDVDRELIIRWILRDYSPVYGECADTKVILGSRGKPMTPRRVHVFLQQESVMTSKVRWWVAGVTFAAVCGLVYVSSPSQANEGDKDLEASVKKIAGAIKSGDTAGAKKMAEASAKKIDEVSDLMHLFRTRKGGLGYGSKVGTNPATDGLEKKIQEFTKAVPPAVASQKDLNMEAATWIAALADLTLAKTPPKDGPGGKTKKAWIGWAKDLRDAADEFSKASAAGNGAAMSKAANKLNNACLSCHSKFKE